MRKMVMAFLIIFFSLSSVSAFAHKISAFVDVEGNKVNLYSYFNSGEPVKNGKVEVYDEKTGKLILTGKTDENGEFSFELPKVSNYKVIVVAELGHKTVAEIKASDFSGSSKESNEETEEMTSKNEAQIQDTQHIAAANLSKEEIRKIVKEELKPIHQKLLDIEMKISEVSLKDIFGGLGWILGIFGAYLAISRKRNEG
ncbi:MAG: carboxypeptidase-like regulatory domain-containing protein [Desulfurobacteriaceae bacterium]